MPLRYDKGASALKNARAPLGFSLSDAWAGAETSLG